MTDTRQQFAARIKTEAAKHIKETPPGSNVSEMTHRFTKRFGWGDHEPWCAETVTLVGLDAGVLPATCASAGAWDLTDRMAKAGLGRTLATVHFPAVISFNYGHGHVGFLLGYDPVKQNAITWEGNTGDGNPAEGDGCYYRIRHLGPGVVHGLGDLVFAPSKTGSTAGKPADRFLHLRTPAFTGLDVKGVQHALNAAGNHLPESGVYDQATADIVNLFNARHHIVDPKTKQTAHGVTAATWAELRKIVH